MNRQLLERVSLLNALDFPEVCKKLNISPAIFVDETGAKKLKSFADECESRGYKNKDVECAIDEVLDGASAESTAEKGVEVDPSPGRGALEVKGIGIALVDGGIELCCDGFADGAVDISFLDPSATDLRKNIEKFSSAQLFIIGNRVEEKSVSLFGALDLGNESGEWELDLMRWWKSIETPKCIICHTTGADRLHHHPDILAPFPCVITPIGNVAPESATSYLLGFMKKLKKIYERDSELEVSSFVRCHHAGRRTASMSDKVGFLRWEFGQEIG